MKYLLIAAVLLASCGQSKSKDELLKTAKANYQEADQRRIKAFELKQERSRIIDTVVHKYGIVPVDYKLPPLDSLDKLRDDAVRDKYYWQSVIDSLNTH